MGVTLEGRNLPALRHYTSTTIESTTSDLYTIFCTNVYKTVIKMMIEVKMSIDFVGRL